VLDGRAGGRKNISLLLVAGGLAVGLLAQIADWLGADSQDVLFSGQASVPDLVAADSTKIVLILFVAKAIAYAVSLGCGFRGGPVFPAIFLGIALATFATVWFDVSPTLAVAVGAAAGTAAVTRLLVTASLFATLLVGTQGVDAVPAAVLAASAAWLVIQAVDRRKAASVTANVVS
jgi:H+/Cl- antiporter ClcA